MLAAAIIVFREVLEAALLVGIVAAATRTVPGRGRWLGAGIIVVITCVLVSTRSRRTASRPSAPEASTAAFQTGSPGAASDGSTR